ncbi:MAG: DNA-directed RNA polymerase subunit L [Desulfurococcales archaeon]|nr:DNA-directed RNA polymerase subunit L [Desulfurococcales archaeon]
MKDGTVEIAKEDEKEIEIVLHGEDHTLANLIVGLAKKEKGVVIAVYDIEHPLKGVPIVRVRTDGNVKPREVLINVLKRAKEMNNKFSELLKQEMTEKGEAGS